MLESINVILTVGMRLYVTVLKADEGDVVHYGERIGDGMTGLRLR